MFVHFFGDFAVIIANILANSAKRLDISVNLQQASRKMTHSPG